MRIKLEIISAVAVFTVAFVIGAGLLETNYDKEICIVRGPGGQGTGFYVEGGAKIITARHVSSQAPVLTIINSDGSTCLAYQYLEIPSDVDADLLDARL